MVVPIIVLLGIPILLGIVYMPPYDMPVKEESSEIPEEPDVSILYYILMGIWTLYLIKILLQVKKGTFKATQRY
ncbi:hypothetical protein C5F49_07555 [Nitrosopumilus oxyclinae]|uniref:Uncharacterized protein n=1 Tax=Nitrosopumilus oxyclinae TaxID=1959104 RepID=A0A7D5M284_9ARCH|nr:hypothetical protein [Nitrosopumilus oxyclinae]QLH05193.1 hypothetical protein C5F49_07555 [Nitrosopumilus oxyclinae]